jgi:hypothetical protein
METTRKREFRRSDSGYSRFVSRQPLPTSQFEKPVGLSGAEDKRSNEAARSESLKAVSSCQESV